MSLTMCLGHRSYSGGNLTVAVSAATTGADDPTQHLIAGSGNWPATPNVGGGLERILTEVIRPCQ
jgi:hypothetical protein